MTTIEQLKQQAIADLAAVRELARQELSSTPVGVEAAKAMEQEEFSEAAQATCMAFDKLVRDDPRVVAARAAFDAACAADEPGRLARLADFNRRHDADDDGGSGYQKW